MHVNKNQCIVAYDLLVTKLERRFPNHELMDDHNTSYNQIVSPHL
jgi:hypothetical protein